MKMEDKKRAPNFSIQEKNLLTNLVFAYKHIIENKKTDTQTWREKDMAWEKITAQFNTKCPQEVPRSKESLRKLYDNMKKKLRKEVADEKAEITKTGGGESMVKRKTDLDEQSKNLLLNTVNKKTIFGLQDLYGGDKNSNKGVSVEYIFEGPSTSKIVDDYIFIPSLEEDEHNYCTADTNQPSGSETKTVHEETPNVLVETPKKWDKVAANSLKRPPTEALQHTWTKRRRPKIQQPAADLTAEYSSLAKVKLECYQAEKENLNNKREHEEILFNLQKKYWELQIKIKELELNKLKHMI